MAEEKKRTEKPARQEWNPHWSVRLLHRIWMVLFTAAKVALGALATVLVIGSVCGLVFAWILGDYLQNDVLPFANVDPGAVDDDLNSFIYVIDGDGHIQEQRRINATINSEWASYDQIPENLVHAAIAIEDKRFYEHQGVDWITTIKACARIFFGDDSKGGSTITQQLIKNTTGENQVTVQRKVQEICSAVLCEKQYSKEQIMELYLNKIYFGQRCKGVKTAAARYFGKELESLSLAECASLISITNNPSIYDPYGKSFMFRGKLLSGYERNALRKQNTLDEMLYQGWITQEEYDEAVAQEIVLKNGIDFTDRMAKCDNCDYRGLVKTYRQEEDKYFCPQCDVEVPLKDIETQEVYSWYEDVVIEDVAKALAQKDGYDWNTATKELKSTYYNIVQRGGYHIYSCQDLEVQKKVDAIYTDLTQIPQTRSPQQLLSAIVIVDNSTGDIVAMAGGVGEKVVYDAWNCATDAKLQTGSAIKPLTVYAPAFEMGVITPATVIKDLPYEYNDGAPWPKNDNQIYSYAETIRNGVVSSINAVSVNTLDIIGAGYSYSFAKEKFGLSTLVTNYETKNGKIKSDENFAALGLGALTVGASVRDMTCAYATFANDGVYRRGRTFLKVYDSDGNLVLDNTQYSEQILGHDAVQYMNYCLDEAARVGTGSNGDFRGMSVAAKTGTTSQWRDRWYCGYTPYYTACVWCGYERPESIQLVGDNSNPAGRLFKKVMQPIHEGLENKPLYNNGEFREIKICLDSGLLATDACLSDVRTGENTTFSRVDLVKVLRNDANVPTKVCNKHILVDYCTSGHGVANEYCKLFAAEGLIELEKKSLVKMTKEELKAIHDAEGKGLAKEYLTDDYIYLINADGTDGIFKGLHGDANTNVVAPYLVCPVHTKEAWDNYVATRDPETDDPGPVEPTTPEDPSSPEDDIWDWPWTQP